MDAVSWVDGNNVHKAIQIYRTSYPIHSMPPHMSHVVCTSALAAVHFAPKCHISWSRDTRRLARCSKLRCNLTTHRETLKKLFLHFSVHLPKLLANPQNSLPVHRTSRKIISTPLLMLIERIRSRVVHAGTQSEGIRVQHRIIRIDHAWQ